MATAGCDHDFDYVQLVVYDVHSYPVSRLVSRDRLAAIKDNGVGMFSALCFLGIDRSKNTHPDFGLQNSMLRPVMSTLTPCHEGKGRVGHVLCDVVAVDGEKVMMTPRAVAERQLDRLAELGLSLKSSFEMEFDLMEASGKPFGHHNKWASGVLIERHMDMFLELLDSLKMAGVPVDTLMTEYGPGMFEATFVPQSGIKSPDVACRFKSLSKAFFQKQGITATYMAKPNPNEAGSGMHYNMSVWTKDGKNAFLDTSQTHNLSALGRHWLAGLVKHCPAITALCSPTINCYRRMHLEYLPSQGDWSVNRRDVSFRLRSEDTNVYLENRIPSAAANPYLVVAACVAAGLEGIKNKYELPDASVPQPPLPRDLDDALLTLEADTAIVEALGADFVKHFVYCKRTFELEKYKGVTSLSIEKQMKFETELYFNNT